MSHHDVTHHIRNLAEALLSFCNVVAVPASRQGKDLLGTSSFQHTDRITLPALSKKVKWREREFMKGKPKKTYVATHSSCMLVSKKYTRKEDLHGKWRKHKE